MKPSPRLQRRKFKDSIPRIRRFCLRILLGIPLLFVIGISLFINLTFLQQGRRRQYPDDLYTSSSSLRSRKSSSIIQRRRLEFVHITKTAGSAIEKAAAEQGILWGACHYMKLEELGCQTPDISYRAPNYQSYALTSPWHTPPKILQRRIIDMDTVQNLTYPYQDADMFTVVRNPYDRFLSEYYCPWAGYKGDKKDHPDTMNRWMNHKIATMEQLLSDFYRANQHQPRKHTHQQQGPNLNEDPFLLAQKHFINQAEYVYDGDIQIIQHVLHYENLTQEFASLMQLYNLSVYLTTKTDNTKELLLLQEQRQSWIDTVNNTQKAKSSSSILYKRDGKLTTQDLYPDTIALINRYAAKDFQLFGYTMR